MAENQNNNNAQGSDNSESDKGIVDAPFESLIILVLTVFLAFVGGTLFTWFGVGILIGIVQLIIENNSDVVNIAMYAAPARGTNLHSFIEENDFAHEFDAGGLLQHHVLILSK